MNRKIEIQVGVTVLVAIAILLWGVAWLSAFAKAHVQRVWHVRFEEAGGLAEGNEAQVNGVRKGSVKSLRLSGSQVLVEVALAKDITLTRTSRVSIRNVGLMGDKVIAVDYDGTGQAYSSRDTINGIYEKGLPEVMAELGGATSGVVALASQLDSLASAMGEGGGMRSTIASFRRTSHELELAVAENRAALHSTLANFSATSESARNLIVSREVRLRTAIDHFASAAENLDHVSGKLDSLRASLQSTASKLENGHGTLGKLVNDDQLYAQLNASVKDLKALINDVKAQPRKYFKFSVF